MKVLGVSDTKDLILYVILAVMFAPLAVMFLYYALDDLFLPVWTTKGTLKKITFQEGYNLGTADCGPMYVQDAWIHEVKLGKLGTHTLRLGRKIKAKPGQKVKVTYTVGRFSKSIYPKDIKVK